MMAKMPKKIETSDENIKDMQSDMSGIHHKVESHATTIKQ